MTAKFALLGLVTMLLWPPNSFGAFLYSAEAIEGWVVDSAQGKPLESVIVVAHWQLKFGLEGGSPINELKIMETVTDSNGHYAFPAWGPKFAFIGTLEMESPQILLFKQGYKYMGLVNTWRPDMDTSRSEWNGKKVKLDAFNGTIEEYGRHLTSLNDFLWAAGYAVGERMGDRCGWKSFPAMLRAMDKLDYEFAKLRSGIRTVAARLRDNDDRLRASGCGSVSDLLGVHK